VNTVLQARPRNFVSTPTLERTARRALRYLQSGYSIHLKGPSGTGKTTLALHLADLLARPIMLLFGDDEFKTSDLIGNQSGYTRKKVVDNFIHSVMKVEDELRHNWIDSRLTLACREGFTLVYDEFNRSRPEVNNVLLSALEEKLLVLPPSNNRAEYIRVSPHFRAIFTSNPEEYCGVHGTQDALQDRLITINMPEPDELAQQQILAQKVGIDSVSASQIVQLVRSFQSDKAPDMASSLRPSLMIATICHEHGIPALAENADFRDTCADILLTRTKEDIPVATRRLWDLFNQFIVSQTKLVEQLSQPSTRSPARLHGEDDEEFSSPVTLDPAVTALASDEPILSDPAAVDMTTEADVSAAPAGVEDEPLKVAEPLSLAVSEDKANPPTAEAVAPDVVVDIPDEAEPDEVLESDTDLLETRIFDFLDTNGATRLVDIETSLELNRFQVVNTLKSLLDQGLIQKQDNGNQPAVYSVRADDE
jgi:gas vesicle protein GvpN